MNFINKKRERRFERQGYVFRHFFHGVDAGLFMAGVTLLLLSALIGFAWRTLESPGETEQPKAIYAPF